MNQKNALEIFRQRAKKNPKLQAAYNEEKKKYQIACKIRECRKRKKLSQKDLATLIGTTQSVISRLENAEYTGLSPSVLRKIADVTS
jgi:ribosome-binding protein aMBF1 (putative translation factor)